MEVGICAPISLLKRETAAPGQRETLEGDFVIPPPNHPLKRPKEGAAAPSLETPPTERQREEKWNALTGTTEFEEASQLAA